MSFTDWPWRHWRAQFADKPALRLNDEVLSWQQLCARIDSLAAGFHRQGVEEGDGVLLLAHNHPHTLLAWLALLQCGARILPVNPQLPRPLLDVLLPQMTLRFALVLDGSYDGLPALSMRETADAYCAAWQPARLASMTLTSGSTGLPKAAVHTCEAHLASARGVLSLMPYGEDDDWLLSLPLFHVSGQGILWRWLQAGARLTVREGIRTFCGYGLTEFASTVCAKEADGEPDVGRALPGREVQVVNGEVWIRAQSMASGYWRDGELIPLTNAQGWFATRDRGEWHDGRLTILGRMDNLFFSGGEGIQPESLERVIATHPQVNQAFIVPLDDAEFGQRPVAVVECEPGTDITTLPDWVRDKVARFEQPVRWLLLPTELKNGGIKVSRRALQEWVNATLKG